MKNRFFIVFISCFMLVSFVFAQEPIYRSYKMEDGLLSNETYYTLSDSRGFIWIATDAGICRFDGYSFKQFTVKTGLPEAAVLRLYEDKKGRLWFTTLSSYVGYIKNDSVFYNSNKFKEEIENITESFAYSIYVDDADTLWVGTIYSGAIFKLGFPYNSLPIKVVAKKNYIMDFNELGGNVYSSIGGYTSPYSLRIEDKSKRRVSEYKLQMPENIRNEFKSIVKNKNELFFIERFNLLYCNIYSGQVSLFKRFENKITFLKFDDDYNLWLGVLGGGIYKFFKKNNYNKFEHYLNGESCSWISEDLESGYWVSTLSSGVLYIPDFDFKTVAKKILGGKQIDKIIKWNDDLIVNEKLKDIYMIEQDSVKKIIPANSLNLTLFKKEQKLYFSSNNIRYSSYDLLRFEPNTQFSQIIATPKKTSLSSISNYFSFNDTVLYGSAVNVFYYYNKNHFFEILAKLKSRINSFVVDENKIAWLATNEGLVKYDINSKSLYSCSQKNKLLGKRIDKIIEDKKGNLWLGTRGDGVFKFDKNKNVEVFDESNGLISNFIRVLYADDENNIWIGTINGIQQINLEYENTLFYYSYLNNFNCGVINDIYRIKDIVWLATSNGLYRFPVSKMNEKKRDVKFPIYIYKISSFKNEKVVSGQEINYDDKNLRFDFVALTYTLHNEFSYKYKLQGLDNDWNYTTNTSVTYPQLQPGKYKFIVMAYSGNNKQSVIPAEFEFSISYPFWQTWWFWFIVILVTAIVSFEIVKARVRKITEKEREKSKVKIALAEMEAKALRSQMNPHFIFNAINSIQNFILKNDSKSAHYFLGKFSRLIRNILEFSKNESITIEQEVELLSGYLELEKLRANNKFSFEISVDGNIDKANVKIPPMLIQPIVENSILHGVAALTDRKGEIKILISQENQTLRVVVTDNGVGREKSYEIKQKKREFHNSMATSISKDRIKLINSIYDKKAEAKILDIYDSNDKAQGTEVTILLPIIKKEK